MQSKKKIITGILAYKAFDNMIQGLIRKMDQIGIPELKKIASGVPSKDMLEYLVFLKCCKERNIFTVHDLRALPMADKMLLAAEFYKQQGITHDEVVKLNKLAREKLENGQP